MSRREKLIVALESAPRDLERMLRPLSAEDALRRPAGDDWCVADVVAHLAYVEGRFLERFARVVAEERPTVPYIHPDDIVHDLSRSLVEHQEAFAQGRAATVAFLRRLEQAEWARELIRDRDQALSTLRDQVQALIDHDSAHLSQIATLRQRLE
jgi:uncharacterized damage-inducible protein DinB